MTFAEDPTRRVWFTVVGVQSRAGRRPARTLEPLASAPERRQRGEGLRDQ